MYKITTDTRLTDELERKLMAQAIEEQMRFKPGKALKSFFNRLFSSSSRENRHVSGTTAQTAS